MRLSPPFAGVIGGLKHLGSHKTDTCAPLGHLCGDSPGTTIIVDPLYRFFNEPALDEVCIETRDGFVFATLLGGNDWQVEGGRLGISASLVGLGMCRRDDCRR